MAEHENDGHKKEKVIDGFWTVGTGSDGRNRNIEFVKKLILMGLSYTDIIKKSSRFFTSRKINEYYNIALEELGNSQNSIDNDVEKIVEKLEKENESL